MENNQLQVDQQINLVESRTETRSSEVHWDRLMDAFDPNRQSEPVPTYQFSNRRTFYAK
jgi:hypothetical protein